MSLKEFAEAMMEPAGDMFANCQEMRPLWFLDNGKDLLIIQTPWADDREKDACCEYVRNQAKKTDANRFAMMSEVWTISMPKEQGLPDSIKLGAGVSSHPDRREAVVLIAQDKTGKSVMITRYILRPEHGKATLSEPHVTEAEAGASKGRLVNILEDQP